jgi:hypothetical protein
VGCWLGPACWPPCWSDFPVAASGSRRIAAWDPLVVVVVAVHCLNCCLDLDVPREVDQSLIRTWCLPSKC